MTAFLLHPCRPTVNIIYIYNLQSNKLLAPLLIIQRQVVCFSIT
jgi:hypothetical protein